MPPTHDFLLSSINIVFISLLMFPLHVQIPTEPCASDSLQETRGSCFWAPVLPRQVANIIKSKPAARRRREIEGGEQEGEE